EACRWFRVTGRRSLGVRNDVEQDARVTLDDEIEAPVTIDARLPDVPPFVVLLRSQGRMPEIALEEARLLPECTANGFRGPVVAPAETVREPEEHQEAERFLVLFFLRESS